MAFLLQKLSFRENTFLLVFIESVEDKTQLGVQHTP